MARYPLTPILSKVNIATMFTFTYLSVCFLVYLLFPPQGQQSNLFLFFSLARLSTNMCRIHERSLQHNVATTATVVCVHAGGPEKAAILPTLADTEGGLCGDCRCPTIATQHSSHICRQLPVAQLPLCLLEGCLCLRDMLSQHTGKARKTQ